MQRFFWFILLLLSAAWPASAQEIQNNLSYRDIPGSRYFRINFENDIVFKTDYYYTQGVHLELISPGLNRLPVKHLFVRPEGSTLRCGIGLESAGYTPMSIVATFILYGDRPFAGMAYLQAFGIALHEARGERIGTTVSAGWMGPAAGGYEIQAYIHRHTGNLEPRGWKYQVKDEPIVNYEVDYERVLIRKNKHFLLSGWGVARAGTLSTKAGAGFMAMAGWFRDPFRTVSGNSRKPSVYIYAHPQVNIVGYDAALQGGPFTRDNPYVIPAADISRITFRSTMGLMVAAGRFAVEGYARYVSKEFSTGAEHLTGGVAAAIAF